MNSQCLTILRTVAGSAPCVSQFLEFQKLGVRVVCSDADPLSAGFVFADAAYTVPRADDARYVETLVDVCRRERVEWVVPALEEELMPLSEAQEAFAAAGTRILLSPPESLAAVLDKLNTYERFIEWGVQTPSTKAVTDVRGPEDISQWPQIIKPRRGRGSNGIYIAHNWDDWEYARRKVDCAITQQFIRGLEYTIDVLCDFDGTPKVISPRRRLATESGISYKGGLHWREDMIGQVLHLLSKLHIAGPANIQCMVDQDGYIWFTEVNARLAGSCILSVAAGVPLLEGTVRMLRGEQPEEYIRPARDLVMLRYWAESYVEAGEAGSLSVDLR